MAETGERGTVVTRFAPSPTGFLHIGGARTALFNYLYAKANGGRFLLRIEDTDRARSTDAAIAAILDGMDWLGLTPDEPPVMQFERAARHAEVAHQLLERGHAYRCYATAEELTAMREAQRAAKQPMRYDGRWRDRTDTPDLPYVVRLRAPQEGSVTIDDRVQGSVTVANAELDDMVLLRSDGTPTYMLAVVVDDEDMGVTHVIRGDDHLNNAFRQLALIRAAGFREPVYAHVPLIHGPDGAKLSKRHGALGVDAYRDDMGMLPEAVENYLLKLGWGHGDEEFMDRARAVEVFDLAGIGRGPARFDFKKLESVNAHYMRAADDARLLALVTPRIEALLGTALPDTARLTALMPDLKARARDLNDLANASLFLFRARPLAMDERAAKLLDTAPDGILLAAHDVLADVTDWSAVALEAAVKALAEAREIGLGKVAQPLRAAVTGSNVSPGLFEVMAVLGRDETLGRITDACRSTGVTA
ncbi:glutamate--tRNA ligase [Glacieibacterium frigidum]|uniref:Glutamate--tRNA ligase n=1 Tax=Glacieibacterium frigidum TaxID=2593303 RepID=A0A552U7Y3_9SPHN|nr:glutamate--tRNA ligase [Glacieibacterium frigidum]TRW14321.1 glutamate--tRNA ligase [Glacieibacterium frigidum]